MLMQKQQGMLNNTDLDKIAKLFDLRFELKARDEIKKIVKEEIKTEVGKLPTKDEFTKQMSKLLKAVEDKENKGLVHDNLHKDLGTDTTRLKQQMQHLFKTFEIEDPTVLAVSI